MDTKLSLTLKAWQQENAELQDKLNSLEGAIPAYTPKPCDCIVKVDWGYRVECECGSIDSACEAARWAERIEIIERFDALRGEGGVVGIYLDINDAVAAHPLAREQLTALLEDNARLRKAVEDWHDAATYTERKVERLRSMLIAARHYVKRACEDAELRHDDPESEYCMDGGQYEIMAETHQLLAAIDELRGEGE